MKAKVLIAAGLVSLMAFCAQASLIYIAIEADVTYVSDTANHLEGNISVGDTISGYYCYESTTPDSNPLSSAGSYWHYAPPRNVSNWRWI